MSDDDSPDKRISRLIQDTAPKPNTAPKPKPTRKRKAPIKAAPPAPQSPVASNIINLSDIRAGRDVTVHVGAPPPSRPVVAVQTGVGVIDAKQKADLTERVKEWVKLHGEIKKTPKTMGAAWASLNRAMGVNSYHELTPQKLPAAIKWLQKQTAILLAMKSAPVKIGNFRALVIKAIKAKCRELGDMHYYVPHLVKTYGVESLTQLSDKQLQEVKTWLFGQRRHR